jgi:hypothetical protein
MVEGVSLCQFGAYRAGRAAGRACRVGSRDVTASAPLERRRRTALLGCGCAVMAANRRELASQVRLSWLGHTGHQGAAFSLRSGAIARNIPGPRGGRPGLFAWRDTRRSWRGARLRPKRYRARLYRGIPP